MIRELKICSKKYRIDIGGNDFVCLSKLQFVFKIRYCSQTSDNNCSVALTGKVDS